MSSFKEIFRKVIDAINKEPSETHARVRYMIAEQIESELNENKKEHKEEAHLEDNGEFIMMQLPNH